MSLLHGLAPAGRMGEAVGVRMSIINASTFAVPLLFGAIGSSLGIAPVFWLVGAALAGGGFSPAALAGSGVRTLQPIDELLAELGHLRRNDDLAIGLRAIALEVAPGDSPPPGRTAPRRRPR